LHINLSICWTFSEKVLNFARKHWLANSKVEMFVWLVTESFKAIQVSFDINQWLIQQCHVQRVPLCNGKQCYKQYCVLPGLNFARKHWLANSKVKMFVWLVTESFKAIQVSFDISQWLIQQCHVQRVPLCNGKQCYKQYCVLPIIKSVTQPIDTRIIHNSKMYGRKLVSTC